jgi:hypothetical protein
VPQRSDWIHSRGPAGGTKRPSNYILPGTSGASVNPVEAYGRSNRDPTGRPYDFPDREHGPTWYVERQNCRLVQA